MPENVRRVERESECHHPQCADNREQACAGLPLSTPPRPARCQRNSPRCSRLRMGESTLGMEEKKATVTPAVKEYPERSALQPGVEGRILPLRSRLRQRGEWGAGLAVAPIAAPSMGARRTGQGRVRGERSERSLDASERSRMIAFGAAASPRDWRVVSQRSATRHAAVHPRPAAARDARVTASENARARHDELDVVGTGDLADIARLDQDRIPRGQRRRQAGRERPPGTAPGPVAGANRGVAHAPFLIVRPGRRWLERHRTPLGCRLERWLQTVDWVGLT